MPTDTSEKGLESLITQNLTLINGFWERDKEQYNREDCVDEDLLFKFLDETQPEEVKKIKSVHGDNYRQRILYLINKKIKDDTVINGICTGGIINVLRKGIIEGQTGINLKIFYDKPDNDKNEKDTELFNKNIFSVTRQVHFSSENEKSLDLVVFINGLPIITFELKNELTKQNVKDAIRQYKYTRNPNEELFRLSRCLVHFAVDTEQVWMCTHLKGSNSNFIPFNKGNNNGAGNPPCDGIKTEYLWKEIITKDSLTNIIQNYIQFIEEEVEKILPDCKLKKDKIKKVIFPRYHQLDVVRKLIYHARESGVGNRYLIQHSAGSGKSNSISWLAHQLVGLFKGDSRNPVFDSIIVVTDRIVLDEQIRRNIKQFEQVQGVVEPITKGGKHLKTALEEGKKIIITTIQKFPVIVSEIGELQQKHFAIIIDEAHSSTSGSTLRQLNQSLYKSIQEEIDEDEENTNSNDALLQIIAQTRKLLQNASYFAFTATPKNKTLELFGEKYKEKGVDKFRAFHLYSMKQAIEENFILDVLQNYTTHNTYFSLYKKIEEDPQYDKSKAIKKMRKYVEGHNITIDKKTALIVDHFNESVLKAKKINGLAKAMVVTSSRKNAVKYKKAFDKYLSELGNPYKSIIAFSGEIDKETESSMNGFSSDDISQEFKKSEYRFLIVANKFQTGFDQPLLHTMYVDKKLWGVNAVQTLSRLNRTAPGKEDTFILDFANNTDEIKESFDPFYETTILGEATDPVKLFELQSALDGFQIYSKKQVEEFSDIIISGKPVDELHSILDKVVENFKNQLSKESQEDFRLKCISYVRLYAFLSQIVPFVNVYLERLFIFLNHLQNKIRKGEDADLTLGILDNIDMDSIRIKLMSKSHIELERGEELKPIPDNLKGNVAEPEMETLSKIVKEFNERFGTNFTNEDKVRKMTNELMQDVLEDKKAIDNIDASLKIKDIQNAKITFTDILKDKMESHIESNFEVYKEYNDNPEFRAFLAGQLFNLMFKGYNNRNVKNN